MCARIKIKFWVVLALATLLINAVTSMSSIFVQAKTTTSGYTIDVNYQNGGAQLNGNKQNVLAGCKLLSLTDDETKQTYDPNGFTLPVTQNKTYSFTLTYSFDGISQEVQSEKIQVVVDKLALQKQQPRANFPVNELKAKAADNQNVSVDLYAYENYSSDSTKSATKLGTASIPSGEFLSNADQINDIISKNSATSTRQFSVGTLKRADGTEVVILGAWNNGGQIYYEPAIDNAPATMAAKANGNVAGIAYKAAPEDKIRLYCDLSIKSMFALDKTALDNNVKYKNVNIVPLTDGKVAAGSKVLVTFTWDISIYDVALKISYNNGKTQDLTTTENYNKNLRKYEGSFTMPNAPVKIVITPQEKKDRRWIGVYNPAGDVFQDYEIGGSRLNVTSEPYTGGSHNVKAYSQVYRNYGLRANNLSRATWGNLPIINNQGLYSNESDYHRLTRAIYATSSSQNWLGVSKNDFFQQSSDLVDGYYNPGGSAPIKYPIQDYKAGSPIEIKYETMRGIATSITGKNTWWRKRDDGSQKPLYVFLPATTGSIDVYPSQRYQSTDDNYKKGFLRYSFRMYQSQMEYNQDPNKAEYGNVTPQNGMYPVQTVLPNGIKITVYPTGYEAKSAMKTEQWVDGNVPNPERSYMDNEYSYTGTDGTANKDNSLVLPRSTFKIKIENCWDDVRVSVGLGTSTVQETQQIAKTSGISEIFARGDSNSNYEYLPDSKGQPLNLIDGSPNYPIQAKNAPVANGKKYHYYKVKPKNGYSVPIPVRTIRVFDKANNATTIEQVDGSVASNIVTVKGNNFNGVGNKFIAGRVAGTNTATSLTISGKPFYEDGYYYYSILADRPEGTESQLSFTSKPIKFDVVFKKFTANGGDYKPSNQGYDVEKQRYFSVPNRLPQTTTGQFFKGWELVVSGKGINGGSAVIKDGSYTDGLYAPGDIVDIVKLNQQIQKIVNTDAVGVTNYSITFNPKYENSSHSAGKVNFQRYYQNKLGENYSAGETASYFVLKNSSFQITGMNKNLDKTGVDYQRNDTKSSPTFIQKFNADNENYAFYYDKGILVSYDKGLGQGEVPKDTNHYTTVQGNANIVAAQTPTNLKAPANKKFIGWKLKVTNKGQVVEGNATYQAAEKIDLASLSKEGNQAQTLRQAIFDAGNVTLVAQYSETVAQIKSEDNSITDKMHPMSETGQWIYERKGYTVVAKFKYAGTNDSYQAAKEAGLINYALYKKDPNSSGLESNDSYKLWISNKQTTQQSPKVSEKKLSDKLNGDGTFTVSFTIVEPKNEASITYRWDNNAKYKVVAWTSANASENNFNAANGSAPGSLANNVAFSKIPAVSILTRVLQPFKIDGQASNSITAQKLLYSDQKLTISFNVTTQANQVLTADDIANQLKIAVGKKDPGSGKTLQVWYTNTKPKDWYDGFDGFTSQGRGGKANKPTVEILNPTGTNPQQGTKFKVTVSGLMDTPPTADPKWQSQAKYYLYVWNDANTQTPTIAKNGTATGQNSQWKITNEESIQSPRKIYTTYIINGQKANATSETAGKAFYGTVSYPANIKMQENTATKKVESTMQKVELNAVWVDSDTTTVHTNNGGITPDNATPQLEHDFSYTVKLQGGNVESDAQNTRLNLAQGNNKLIAFILKDGTNAIPNGNLGTLDFKANNPNAVRSLNFKLQTESIPASLTKDAFSGNLQYVFTKNEIGGNAS